MRSLTSFMETLPHQNLHIYFNGCSVACVFNVFFRIIVLYKLTRNYCTDVYTRDGKHVGH